MTPGAKGVVGCRRDACATRVPFGHSGLEIRHPLRGLGVQVIDGKCILPETVHHRLQLGDTTLIFEVQRMKIYTHTGEMEA